MTSLLAILYDFEQNKKYNFEKKRFEKKHKKRQLLHKQFDCLKALLSLRQNLTRLDALKSAKLDNCLIMGHIEIHMVI